MPHPPSCTTAMSLHLCALQITCASLLINFHLLWWCGIRIVTSISDTSRYEYLFCVKSFWFGFINSEKLRTINNAETRVILQIKANNIKFIYFYYPIFCYFIYSYLLLWCIEFSLCSYFLQHWYRGFSTSRNPVNATPYSVSSPLNDSVPESRSRITLIKSCAIKLCVIPSGYLLMTQSL